MSSHDDSQDPFRSIDLDALDTVNGGTERVAGAASRNNQMNDAVDQITNTLDQLKNSGGSNQMMMMVMMMMMNGQSPGRTIKTGGLLGATTVSG